MNTVKGMPSPKMQARGSMIPIMSLPLVPVGYPNPASAEQVYW